MSEYANYDDFNDENEPSEYDIKTGKEKKVTPQKVIKKIFIYALRIIAVAVFAILFWRLGSSKDTKLAKAFIWTEENISSYTQNPSEFLAYKYMRNDNITEDGKFLANNIYFVPSKNQFQITLRYNNSTLKKLAEEYNLDNLPDGEVFVYALTDNLGNIYSQYEYAVDKKNLYNYRRILFENIDMQATKETVNKNGEKVIQEFESLYLNIYYKDDINFEEPYGVLEVYSNDFYHEPMDLEDYKTKDNKPNMELTPGTSFVAE